MSFDVPTVLDTTVLSNFAHVEGTEILNRLPNLCTVPEVEAELRDGVDSYPYLENAVDEVGESIRVAEMDEEALQTATKLEERLDSGEAEALAVAQLRDGTLVTDDGRARQLARSRGVSVTGSVGILITAVEDGTVDRATADSWLKHWVDEAGYRVPSRHISDYL